MDLDKDLEKNQRFLRETEHEIRLTNNKIIHENVAPITSERIVSFAVEIAKLRAQYITAAFDFADKRPLDGLQSDVEIDDLEKCRRGFEEARDAFIALQRAIELGYVTVEYSRGGVRWS